MGQAIGQVLSFGVGVALSPVPIIAVALMLATPKGRVNGPAFLAGWIARASWCWEPPVLLLASGASASKAGLSGRLGAASSRSSWASCCCCSR